MSDITIFSPDGVSTSALAHISANAHYAPACVFGAGVNQWVPMAIAYAQGLIENGAEANIETIDHAARVIVNLREKGPAYAGVRAVLCETQYGRVMLGLRS